jgi:murein L,D-transpeptidase YafK
MRVDIVIDFDYGDFAVVTYFIELSKKIFFTTKRNTHYNLSNINEWKNANANYDLNRIISLYKSTVKLSDKGFKYYESGFDSYKSFIENRKQWMNEPSNCTYLEYKNIDSSFLPYNLRRTILEALFELA